MKSVSLSQEGRLEALASMQEQGTDSALDPKDCSESGAQTGDLFDALRFILLTMIVGLSTFEIILHLLFVDMNSWDAHLLTISFSSLFATMVACFALKRVRMLLRKTRDEIAIRRKAEEVLQFERNRSVAILEAMQDGVYIVDHHYDIEYVNPVLEKEYGPVEGKKCYEYLHDRVRICPWCINARVFAGETVRWMWFSPKNGRTYDLFDTPIRKADGSVSKLEIFRDITDMKKSEQALRESEERYRMLFNKANDALFVLELKENGMPGNYLEVNDVACEKFGYTREELLRRSPSDMEAPETIEMMPQVMERFIRENHIIFESVLLARDGKKVSCETSAHLFDYKGRPTILSIKRDITERKMAEHALRKSETEFRKLSQQFDTLLNAISDTLLLLSPHQRILWANSAAVCFVNQGLSNLTGQYCYVLCKGRTEPCEDCPAVRSFRSGKIETKISNRNGRFLDIRAYPIREEREVGNVILLASDITEKMTLQAEAMQACHLASLGELAAGVAHEINNPVNGIINYAQILINKSGEESRERDLGRRIVKESDRIANIVRSLLSFSSQNGEERRYVTFDALLKESLVLTMAQLRKERIQLKLEASRDVPEILCCFQQIQQVFLNIINNARYALNQKYPRFHEDKVLEISGETEVVEGRLHVRVSFRDHGTGIPAAMLPMVLKPFFTTKPHGKGTGLGLAISRRIVNDHGGRLTIESVEGQFTMVTAYLPVGLSDEGKNTRGG